MRQMRTKFGKGQTVFCIDKVDEKHTQRYVRKCIIINIKIELEKERISYKLSGEDDEFILPDWKVEDCVYATEDEAKQNL